MSRLIDADKAKEVLTKLLYETALNNSGGASLMCEDIAENRLETWFGLVPTVDAEPVRHGHWIERTKVHPDLLNDSTYNYECSECGYWDQHGSNVEVPYCWHCGAKMDEVTE